jgi:hypothetical protein
LAQVNWEPRMAIAFEGAMHRTYSYREIEKGAAPLYAGNFLLARIQNGVPFIIYAGEGENIRGASGRLWNAARVKYAATLLYARHNHSEQDRVAEQADLVALHKPPMNRSG